MLNELIPEALIFPALVGHEGDRDKLGVHVYLDVLLELDLGGARWNREGLGQAVELATSDLNAVVYLVLGEEE